MENKFSYLKEGKIEEKMYMVINTRLLSWVPAIASYKSYVYPK